jgi:hypothetical protein
MFAGTRGPVVGVGCRSQLTNGHLGDCNDEWFFGEEASYLGFVSSPVSARGCFP